MDRKLSMKLIRIKYIENLDKVSCISAIKMNEFILYYSRFALPLQCRTMARTTTTMWTARWCSISSMFLSEKYSLRSAITFGIHLIFSMRRNSMRRRDCITMGQGTMSQGWACGLAAILKKKTTLHSIVIVTRQIIP